MMPGGFVVGSCTRVLPGATPNSAVVAGRLATAIRRCQFVDPLYMVRYRVSPSAENHGLRFSKPGFSPGTGVSGSKGEAMVLRWVTLIEYGAEWLLFPET